MSEYVQKYVEVQFHGGGPETLGGGFILSNPRGDRIEVDTLGSPLVKDFVNQSVISESGAYFKQQWNDRVAWAAAETKKSLDQLQREYEPAYMDLGLDTEDCVTANLIDKALYNQAGPRGVDLDMGGDFGGYLPEEPALQPTPIDNHGFQFPSQPNMTGKSSAVDPIEPGYQYPDPSQGVLGTPITARDQGTPATTFGVEDLYPVKTNGFGMPPVDARISTGGHQTVSPPPSATLTPGPFRDDSPFEPMFDLSPELASPMAAAQSTKPLGDMDMVVDPSITPAKTPEADAGSNPSTTGTKTPQSAAKKVVDKDISRYPFVKQVNSGLTENDWQFLVNICAHHFIDNHDKFLAGTEKRKTKPELMAMTLLDPRVAGADKDYSVTFRQFEGQLYERKIVGGQPDVIEHTRAAIVAKCFDKPQDRKDRRKKPAKGTKATKATKAA